MFTTSIASNGAVFIDWIDASSVAIASIDISMRHAAIGMNADDAAVAGTTTIDREFLRPAQAGLLLRFGLR